MVQAGVSVLNSASQVLLSKRLRKITDHWGSELSKIKKSNKRIKKCRYSSSELTSNLQMGNRDYLLRKQIHAQSSNRSTTKGVKYLQS